MKFKTHLIDWAEFWDENKQKRINFTHLTASRLNLMHSSMAWKLIQNHLAEHANSQVSYHAVNNNRWNCEKHFCWKFFHPGNDNDDLSLSKEAIIWEHSSPILWSDSIFFFRSSKVTLKSKINPANDYGNDEAFTSRGLTLRQSIHTRTSFSRPISPSYRPKRLPDEYHLRREDDDQKTKR